MVTLPDCRCDTVLVVEDGANGSDFDFSLWNLIRSAAVLLGNEAYVVDTVFSLCLFS